MTTPVAKAPLKTIADWLAQPQDARLELIDGELIEKAAPSFEHGIAQGATLRVLGGPFHRKPGGPNVDTVKKLHRYHQAGVPHYWIIDQQDATLTVYRHTADGYLVVLAAEAHERVRAEPFDAIEVEVRVLLGGDPE